MGIEVIVTFGTSLQALNKDHYLLVHIKDPKLNSVDFRYSIENLLLALYIFQLAQLV